MTSHRPSPEARLSWIAPDLSSGDDLLLVRALLDRAAGRNATSRSLDKHQYDALAVHRILALVPRSWSSPPDTNLRADGHALAAQQLALLADATRVVSLLGETGIEHRILKGAASCFLDYHEPSLRTFGDIDILVKPEEFHRTLKVLAAECGATERNPGRQGYRFRIEAMMTLPSGTEIDVHRRLSPFARSLSRVFEDCDPLPELGGVALPVELRLCNAALHVMGSTPGGRRLSGLADIAAIRSSHTINLDATRRWAEMLGTEALVGLALAVERTARGLPVDTDHWAAPTLLERKAFAQSERRIFFEQMHRMWQFTGVRERVAFVLSGLAPSRSQADQRGGFVEYYRRLGPKWVGRSRD